MIRHAFFLMAGLLLTGSTCDAQTAKSQEPASKARVPGELWSVSTVKEFSGSRLSEPAKRENQQYAVCYPRGTVGLESAANAELPEELSSKCWLSDKRTETNRQQTKYACRDGITAEIATRRELDGSFGSMVVVNLPDKGGIAVTRTMRRMQGSCDASVKPLAAPAQPAPPLPPASPAIDKSAK
jgi:hypothetical protein